MQQALKPAARGIQAVAQRRTAAFGSTRPARRAAVRVAAVAEPSSSASSSSAPLVLEWQKDNETIKDVFAFAGSLPERLNGRLAMLGFAGIMAAEHSSKVPALEQFGSDALGVILLSITLTLGSLAPKFASGSSLKDLHAAATGANLKAEGLIGQFLGLFDTNIELWTGRVAMIGLVGTLVAEAVTGNTIL
ncbi:early light-inducible protein [Monoraphidium neglectum]|uniref:Early light-inducible protein n=1 Tax=Monoraphidium neglectum TaxID=145388 RepID=A0A0D2N599_9CHLO|nr:early light-inducible protein [Monoraphidium neglectum]KIZ07472.1 early light-inducible protein [Monoraphidium neglectum]|eukprot:XP_013906491.1 early light-inducible protein [Monoraphidium neglectum]